jgi:hypothetical protein
MEHETYGLACACVQEARPEAEKLLLSPLFEEHELRQEDTMRNWLLEIGEPRGESEDGEEPVFMRWNSNPLLLAPTPRETGGGKHEISETLEVEAAKKKQKTTE